MEEIAKYFDGDDAVDLGEVAIADMKEQARDADLAISSIGV
jgi:hypothetical protein